MILLDVAETGEERDVRLALAPITMVNAQAERVVEVTEASALFPLDFPEKICHVILRDSSSGRTDVPPAG